MTRKALNKNVHTRVNNMLAHRGLARIVGSAEGAEWGIVRAAITEGGSPKVIAKKATRAIVLVRETEARLLLDDLAREEITHDPIEVASAWMPRA